MPNEPDRIYIEKNDKAIYEEFETIGIFREKGNKDLFIYAMITGFEKQIRKSLTSRLGFVRVDYFNDEDLALIYSLAMIESKSIDVLSDRKAVYQMAEEYAHAGLILLHDKIEKSPYEVFESSLEFEMMKKIEPFLKASPTLKH